MNPLKLMKLQGAWNTFKANHPKFPLFVSALAKEGITENTIIEMKVTTPDGKEFQSNIKLTASDMELIHSLKDLTTQ